MFREGGLEKLMVRGNGGGRKSKANAEVQEALTEKLRRGEFRTAGQVLKWLKEEHDIVYGENSVYYLLGKLGGRLKVPRPCHQKKDPQEEAQFRETLADRMRELPIAKDKEVVLWVYDEMRYGLHPLLRRMWSLVGTRVVAPVKRRFQWGYLFGAISVEGGRSEFLYTDGINKEMDRCFVNQIVANDPEKVHVIIGDGAGFHHKEGQEGTTALPSNVHILTLPPYSPELNPIEKLWDIVKDGICNVNWPNLRALEDYLTQVLSELWDQPDGFTSLFANSYLRSELNASNKIVKACPFY
jgi:transposase